MLSRQAKGLFHRAIGMSSSFMSNKSLDSAEQDNVVFLKKTGCQDTTCLRKLNITQILQVRYTAKPWILLQPIPIICFLFQVPKHLKPVINYRITTIASLKCTDFHLKINYSSQSLFDFRTLNPTSVLFCLVLLALITLREVFILTIPIQSTFVFGSSFQNGSLFKLVQLLITSHWAWFKQELSLCVMCKQCKEYPFSFYLLRPFHGRNTHPGQKMD